ncbi:MAG: histidine kinase [Panacibacter sp.]
MNSLKPNKTEWISFFALMPVIDAVLNYLLFGDRIWKEPYIWLLSFPVVFVQGFVSWYLHIITMHWYRVKFPLLKQTILRLVLLYVTHIGLITLTYITLFHSYGYAHFLGYNFSEPDLQLAIFSGLALTLVATTMWEAEYIIVRWKESLAEKEGLEQLAIQHEFETLKSQVNPHFLFNCFNTLSSLISEDPNRADEFLNELSKVYRYLLRSNEDGLSTLQNELNFIQSYYRLLETRYGQAVQLTVEVDKKYNNYLLPSLSLQLLVENAVKHNTISRQQPLTIDIFSMAGNKLAVNNNLQCKLIKAPSNRIGLQNIRSKYELLNQQGFQVLEDTKNFTVVLPLIWNKATDKQLAFMQKNTEKINLN